MALLINKYSIDWVIKIQFVEAGCGFALQEIGIVVPEVKIAIIYAQNRIISAAFNGQYLCAAHFFSPCHFVCLNVDDAKLSLTGSEDEVISVVIGKVIAWSYFWKLFLLLRFDEEVIVL